MSYRQSAAKPIHGYEHRYTITEDGVVCDILENRQLRKDTSSRFTLVGTNLKTYKIPISKLLSTTFADKYSLDRFVRVHSEPGYLIDKRGNLYNIKRKMFIKQTMKNGYLRYGKASGERLVHRMIAKQFIPNPNNFKTVNHIDGNKLNNDISNLEWLTNEDNIKHSWETGLKKPCFLKAIEFIDSNAKSFVVIGLERAGNVFGIHAPTMLHHIKKWGNTGKRITVGALKGYIVNTVNGRFIDYSYNGSTGKSLEMVDTLNGEDIVKPHAKT